MIDHDHYDLVKNKKLSEVIDNPMLTTKDNPFNPFTDFEKWFKYDSILGHNSCNVLDRLANTSETMFAPEKNDEIINKAMKRIIELDFLNVFIIVSEKDYKNNLLIVEKEEQKE